ncbi:sugar ABC transporter ATP-binding protein [Pseudonocardia eucalypti]|uniref:Sugar ABC transporter ATP-binding protein n=1 Tax=Pseudonocardia eucalypti TaxID=648755 RepID=A0ABP9RE01_9PSEU|nr:ribose transport system ATP-binding protein [Pseudonocardia eucalypti]
MNSEGDGPVLEARGLDKSFGGVAALRRVDFTLRAGEVHALVGENGAGKSTLIKVLTGVHRPDAGEVRYAGRPVAFGAPIDAQRAGICTIYQEVNLVGSMSVAANLFLGREPRRFGPLVDRHAMHRAAGELLAGLGIDVDPRRRLDTLGLGTQQMVALARAASTDAGAAGALGRAPSSAPDGNTARVMIMDEPTSSLEPREVSTLFEVVRGLRERGIAIVFVSHRLAELYELCETVTVLRDGAVAHTGNLAGLSRLRLISLMLGRELEAVRHDGTTTFHPEQHAKPGEPLLRARGLTSRGTLGGVDLDVRAGEVVGLAGLLGSGRSETMTALAGVAGRDSGTVSLAGRELSAGAPAAIRAGLVLVPEDRKAEGLVLNLSVRENIVLAALPRLSRFGVVSRARQDRVVDTFIRRLRIKVSGPDQPVSELSGGNQQKVMLARWLAMSPKVLLLDEPTRGIDVGAKAEVQTLIDELAADGLGILLVSSDLEELVEGAAKVVVMRDGTSVAELTGARVSVAGVMDAIAQGGEGSASTGRPA